MDWLRFYYSLKNTTDTDYRLDAASANLMARLKDSGSLLHDTDITSALMFEYPVFIPAKQTVRLMMHLPSEFKE